MQFLTDQIEQLDLALDQLAIKDRNFDRFAMMLIDNVVELTLHSYATDCSYHLEATRGFQDIPFDKSAGDAALGRNFDDKIRLATLAKLVPDNVADSLQKLHNIRNTVYHRGLRHERILHSLALFYFDNACLTLSKYSPWMMVSSSSDRISYRALKYIGNAGILSGSDAFKQAWDRLRVVATSMDESLIADLHADMEETIDATDHNIQFLADDAPKTRTRNEVIFHEQVWRYASSEKGKAFAEHNGAPKLNEGWKHIDWFFKNYSPSLKTDPVPSWRNRLASLEKETDKHLALTKYSDFMKQTEEIRSSLEESAGSLDAHIQMQIDHARGK